MSSFSMIVFLSVVNILWQRFCEKLINGDCNQDSEQIVIDIVYNMNHCIFDIVLDDCGCADLNNDNQINILDIVLLVNIILED